MANLALGIDTGGTFTDGVIFDLNTSSIIKKTKTITTRHDLTVAINNCLSSLLEGEPMKIDLGEIRMVSLSTTLATNAIVEGQGAEVGLILLGFKPQLKLPTPHVINIAGACNIKGKIKEQLDLAAARKEIKAIKAKVDAFAVSGYLSIRNPVQELKIASLVREMTGYPVVCAHQLSSELGFYERTVTAVFNARLMPLITDLIDAVKGNLIYRGIEAPLMVVKGDGSLISEEKAREKPVETSLSGPAASIIGAMTLTGIEDAVVVDMGGTTTDVAIYKKGKPNLTQKGARVGGWLTRVKAADITTIGLGGDSFIQVSKEGILTLGPQKVFPLSWIVTEHPHLYWELKEIQKNEYYPLSTQPTSILVYIKDPVNLTLTGTEKKILELIKEKPHSLYYISKKLNKEPELLPWDHLVKVGSVHRAGLTPTDILHFKGEFTSWSVDAAVLGVKIEAARYNTGIETFSHVVLKEMYYQVAAVVTEVLFKYHNKEVSLTEGNIHLLLKEMLAGRTKDNRVIEFSVKSKLPLIAVGAPVRAYFPEIARRLNTELFLPESTEVANAVGTVSGKVIERVIVLLKPGDKGGFLVHTPMERESFISYKKALEFARKRGKEIACEMVKGSGASDIEILLEQRDKYSDYLGQISSKKVEDKMFIESIIKITAIGRPW